jgi:hypothetical protein
MFQARAREGLLFPSRWRQLLGVGVIIFLYCYRLNGLVQKKMQIRKKRLTYPFFCLCPQAPALELAAAAATQPSFFTVAATGIAALRHCRVLWWCQW